MILTNEFFGNSKGYGKALWVGKRLKYAQGHTTTAANGLWVGKARGKCCMLYCVHVDC
jgi:hypothetical protein